MLSATSSLPDKKKPATHLRFLQRTIVRYSLALVLVALALGVALLSWRAGIRHQMSMFLFGIAFAAWYGGVGPAIVAVVCSSLAYDYFFTQPFYTFATSGEDLPNYALFVLYTLLVGWFGLVRRRAEAELRQSRDVLNVEVERRRALNRELEKRSDELQATNKELEAFAYSVSHDLRAPLRHMSGYAELLQKTVGAALDAKGVRFMAMILESAKRMGDLIDDLLAFSRIGRAETQWTHVDMNQLVADVVAELRRETAERDIVWNVGSVSACDGDRSMLRLVLLNLLSNAVKFTRGRPQAVIEIGSLSASDGEVVVFVRDNGAGFDMRYVHKLFGVFQRLHRADAFEGTGIGLATVQRIIHRHGGTVRGEGIVDQGATFTFSIPKRVTLEGHA